MNTEIEHDYFNCEVMVDDPNKKAIKVRLRHNGAEFWVPRSLCELRNGEAGPVMEVEAWFAEQEGMHG